MLKFFKDVLPSLTASLPVQNISPDAMIVNGLMQSFASEFPDWALQWGVTNNTFADIVKLVTVFPDVKPRGPKWSRYDAVDYRKFELVNKKKDITFTIIYSYANYRKSAGSYEHVMEGWTAKINGVEIDGRSGRQLADAYLAVKKKHDAVKQAADKALAEMKADQAKWDIAEKILGMKRTKSGRLIAVSSYCPVCDAHEPEKGATHNLSCPNRPQPKPRRPKVIKEPLREVDPFGTAREF